MERQLHNGYHICFATAASVNKNKSGISACIRGKQNTCGGYHWEVVK